ncbi:plasmid pRiA4b ORF-3 family protein [Flavobacteriaceae bacterium]|jgi:hypothetical protein|nr:plasmid pRiA4b ORF-3 family protein [Flavobacteriaceae bacterium]|tara:strand:- start:7880 stop:8353 length:474 start_codon:yes stop_codon:yes gene_type:complete
MIFRIRIILDTKEDIIRDIEIENNSTFKDLHTEILKSFQFDGNEMASFYLSNDNWDQGKEISLSSFQEEDELIMENCPLDLIINENQKKFIYIYDFLNLWTFFVEIFEINPIIVGAKYPKLIFSLGKLPEKAPDKNFEKIKDNEFEDNFEDDYNDYN